MVKVIMHGCNGHMVNGKRSLKSENIQMVSVSDHPVTEII